MPLICNQSFSEDDKLVLLDERLLDESELDELDKLELGELSELLGLDRLELGELTELDGELKEVLDNEELGELAESELLLTLDDRLELDSELDGLEADCDDELKELLE